MSVIKPFKGWRPGVDIVQKLASRPYDVLNTEEARKECEGNPYSLLHVTKAEIDLPAGYKSIYFLISKIFPAKPVKHDFKNPKHFCIYEYIIPCSIT